MAKKPDRRPSATKKMLNSKPRGQSIVRKPRMLRVSKIDRTKRREEIKAGVRRMMELAKRKPDPAVSGPKVTVIRGPKQVSSSWVDAIAYIRYGRKMGVAVLFLNGTQVIYPNTTTKDYEYLRDAGSKGKAIWRRFYDLPYEILN